MIKYEMKENLGTDEMKLLTTSQAAKIISERSEWKGGHNRSDKPMTISTVIKYIKEGRLKPYNEDITQTGGQYLIKENAIEAFLKTFKGRRHPGKRGKNE